MTDAMLSLGRSRRDESPIELPSSALLRHVMALGSSGSGKTVFCKVLIEEVVRHGLPAICIDPQGDLCSLALDATDPEALAERGVDPSIAEAFSERADVVVFTPASTAGIGLSADPVNLVTEHMGATERTHAISRTASIITGLLGYDPESDDGTGLTAVLDRCLEDLVEQGRASGGLAVLSEYMHELPAKKEKELSRYLDLRKLKTARQRLARLDVGARRMLFHQGAPIDIDLLLGRGAHEVPGRTRVAVIYLNTLHGQDDKDFFVAALVDQLYAWMLRNPSPQPQAMFYIDEVAPFVPPVRKPAAKPGLQLLFKQARKYGVCCLMATQNPGDVDYKAMAQFGTWALGRLTTRQDLKKVEPTIKSVMPTASDRVMSALPSLGPGQFVLVCPDHWEDPQELAVRWLITPHETLDEGRIEGLADERWRDRFADVVRERGSKAAAEAKEAKAENSTDAPDPAVVSEEISAAEEPEVSDEFEDTDEPDDIEEPGDLVHPDGVAEPTMSTTPAVPAAPPPAQAPAPSNSTLIAHPVPPPPARGPRRPRRAAPVPVRTGMTQIAPSPNVPTPGAPEPPPVTAAPFPGQPAAVPAQTTQPLVVTAPTPSNPVYPPTPAMTPPPVVASPIAAPPAAPPPIAPAPVAAPPVTTPPPVATPPATPPIARAPVAAPPAPAVPPVAAPPTPPAPEPPPVDPREERKRALAPYERALAQRKSMTLTDFAKRAKVGQKKGRTILQEMMELGLARMYPEGRKKMYWAVSSGGRPDLGMPKQITIARPLVDHATIWSLGQTMLRSKVLGVFGDQESLQDATQVYRPVYRLDFEEKVPRPLLRRVFGESHDLRLGSIYLHPTSLDVLVYTPARGIRFVSEAGEHASAVEDLDGVATFEDVGPGTLGLVDEDWHDRRPPAEAKARFTERFAATPSRVSLVFVPLWRLTIRAGAGESFRVVDLDGLCGRPVTWPRGGG